MPATDLVSVRYHMPCKLLKPLLLVENMEFSIAYLLPVPGTTCNTLISPELRVRLPSSSCGDSLLSC